MAKYRLKKTNGCIVHEIDAVQFKGDPADIRLVFPDVQISHLNPDGALVVTDRNGDQRFVLQGDFIFEHPTGSDHIVVLSEENFLDTYREASRVVRP